MDSAAKRISSPTSTRSTIEAMFGERRAPDGTLVADNFARWFGQSQVVDAEGAPLALFHGTACGGIECFDRDTHFGTYAQAEDRAAACPGETYYRVFLRLLNPKRLADAGAEWSEAIEQAVAEGHDGIVYLNRAEGLSQHGLEDAIADALTDDEFRAAVPAARDSYVIFSPEQVKAADGNIGLFDSHSTDITDRQAWQLCGAAEPPSREILRG